MYCNSGGGVVYPPAAIVWMTYEILILICPKYIVKNKHQWVTMRREGKPVLSPDWLEGVKSHTPGGNPCLLIGRQTDLSHLQEDHVITD